MIFSKFPTSYTVTLGCLIEAIENKDDLLCLCDELDGLVHVSPDLKHLISELRKGKYIL